MAELYHAWLKKGEQAENHKYIRREWRNGRWYYYYSDGTKTVDYPKGQNYKTKSTKESSNKSSKDDIERQSARTRKYQEIAESVDNTIDQLVTRGEDAVDRLRMFLNTPAADLFDK